MKTLYLCNPSHSWIPCILGFASEEYILCAVEIFLGDTFPVRVLLFSLFMHKIEKKSINVFL